MYFIIACPYVCIYVCVYTHDIHSHNTDVFCLKITDLTYFNYLYYIIVIWLNTRISNINGNIIIFREN